MEKSPSQIPAALLALSLDACSPGLAGSEIVNMSSRVSMQVYAMVDGENERCGTTEGPFTVTASFVKFYEENLPRRDARDQEHCADHIFVDASAGNRALCGERGAEILTGEGPLNTMIEVEGAGSSDLWDAITLNFEARTDNFNPASGTGCLQYADALLPVSTHIGLPPTEEMADELSVVAECTWSAFSEDATDGLYCDVTGAAWGI
ncbi:hypothetical protein IPG41_04050 [Candidatus Peregrinibacteria bacterium]|nr:MAG: hypothetical protein IPG41_04050 [Candidatus Peregrinibacteria bacterium]